MYYDDIKTGENTEHKNDIKPNGVFEIAKMNSIQKKSELMFDFQFGPRVFEFKTENAAETDIWVTCL